MQYFRITFIVVMTLFFNVVYAVNSWNGNASIVSYSSGSNTGFGLDNDVTLVHSSSGKDPVVFFQWEKDSNDGKNIKISADEYYTTATITYGSWASSSSEKITYKDVSLPFVIDPTLDGFTNDNGDWYTIAVSFNSKPSDSDYVSIRAEATNENGNNSNRGVFKSVVRLENSYYWSGNGSLISKASKKLTGYGLNYDIAKVKSESNNPLLPSVFFQWEIDSSDGKSLKISSDMGCFKQAKITTGEWFTRNDDTTVTVNLPYTIPTNKNDGEWLLVRVDLLSKPTCDDNVRAEIVKKISWSKPEELPSVDYLMPSESKNSSDVSQRVSSNTFRPLTLSFVTVEFDPNAYSNYKLLDDDGVKYNINTKTTLTVRFIEYWGKYALDSFIGAILGPVAVIFDSFIPDVDMGVKVKYAAFVLPSKTYMLGHSIQGSNVEIYAIKNFVDREQDIFSDTIEGAYVFPVREGDPIRIDGRLTAVSDRNDYIAFRPDFTGKIPFILSSFNQDVDITISEIDNSYQEDSILEARARDMDIIRGAINVEKDKVYLIHFHNPAMFDISDATYTLYFHEI